MIAFTQQVALQNAEFGIRANVILPGLMDTPMAVDTRARRTGKPRAEIAAARDAKVPLRQRMGTAWDVPPTRLISSLARRCRSMAGRWFVLVDAWRCQLPSGQIGPM